MTTENKASTPDAFAGYQETLFSKGAQFMIDCAKVWMESELNDLPEETVTTIAALRDAFAKKEIAFATKLAKLDMTNIDNLDKVASLMTQRATLSVELSTTIAMLTLEQSAKAFGTFLSSYGLKVAGTRTSSGLAEGMYRVKVGTHTRYYAVTPGKVVCYSANGANSQVLHVLTPTTYPNLYPTSETALQRLHYVAYAETTKSHPDVASRLQTAESSYANWNEVLGRPSKATNGHNDTTKLDKVPADWLKENPAEEPTDKVPDTTS